MKNWLPRLLTIATVVIGLRLAASHMPDKSAKTTENKSPTVEAVTTAISADTSAAKPVTSTTLQDLVAGKFTAKSSELISLLKEANSQELLHLSNVVINSSASNEVRQTALYALAQLGDAAVPALTNIATSKVPESGPSDPHAAPTYQLKEEVGLRVSAIEALDRLSISNSHIKASMQKVLETQTHRTLTLLAQISISGIESGHPGKAQRAIETLVKENN